MKPRNVLAFLILLALLVPALAAGQACNINPYEVRIINESYFDVDVSWSGGPESPTLDTNECFKIDANEGDDLVAPHPYEGDGTDNTSYQVTIRIDGQVTRFDYIECTDPEYSSQPIADPPSVCTQPVAPGRSLIDGSKNDLYVSIDDEGLVHMGWEAANGQTLFTDMYREDGYFSIFDPDLHPIGASAWLSFYLNIIELDAPEIPPVSYQVTVENNLDQDVRVNGTWEATPYQEFYSPNDGTLQLVPHIYVTANNSDWKFGYWTQWRPDLGYWSVPDPSFTTEYANGTLEVYLDQVPPGTTTLEFDGEYEVIKGGGSP